MKPPSIAKKKLTRRSFFKYGIRLSALAFVGFGFAGRNNLATERHNLRFPNLPPAFEGYTIVQISDLHASFWVGRGYLSEVVDRVNAMAKDLVVITGDIITGSVNDFWKRWLPGGGGNYVEMAAEVLSRLAPGPKLAVLGNHDHWDGKKTEQRLVDALSKTGITVLRNRSIEVTRGEDRLFIAGTDDYWFTCNVDLALRDVPPDSFNILLSHNPDVRTAMGKFHHVDLTLCGHTHGGQVVVPYLTHHFMPIKDASRYLAGLVKEPHGYTYVNRGIGTLVFPFRIGAPPEITSLTLVRA